MGAQATSYADHYGSKVATTAKEEDLNHCGYHLTAHRVFKIITENKTENRSIAPYKFIATTSCVLLAVLNCPTSPLSRTTGKITRMVRSIQCFPQKRRNQLQCFCPNSRKLRDIRKS